MTKDISMIQEYLKQDGNVTQCKNKYGNTSKPKGTKGKPSSVYKIRLVTSVLEDKKNREINTSKKNTHTMTQVEKREAREYKARLAKHKRTLNKYKG